MARNCFKNVDFIEVKTMIVNRGGRDEWESGNKARLINACSTKIRWEQGFLVCYCTIELLWKIVMHDIFQKGRRQDSQWSYHREMRKWRTHRGDRYVQPDLNIKNVTPLIFTIVICFY